MRTVSPVERRIVITLVHLEMATVGAGNHTHAADDIDWSVSQIDCPCQWQFVNSYPMILHWLQGGVVSQIGNPVKPYSLSSVEICSST